MRGRRPGVGTALGAAGIAFVLFAVLTAVLAVHGWGPHRIESAMHSWAVAHRPSPAVRIVGIVTDLGTGVPPYLAALAAGFLLVRHATRPVRRIVSIALFCAPLVVLAAGQLARHVTMRVFARPRPPTADWVVASPSGYSYPSGHAFTAAVAAGLLAWAILRGPRRPWTPPVLALLGLAACAVGLSRVYLGVHWPFDIVGGWLLAALWLCLTLPLIPPIAALPADPRPPTAPGCDPGAR